MKSKKASVGFAAALIALSITLTGCAGAKEDPYANQQQGEMLQVEKRAQGNIDLKFKTPPTMEDKATSKIQGISSIQDLDENGALMVSSNKKKLIKVVRGEVVWESNEDSQAFENAKFVQEGDRAWIVGTRKVDNNLEVSVYDAYSYAKGQSPLRRKEIPNGQAMVSAEGTIIADGQAIYRYYASTGLMSKIDLAKGSTLLAPTTAGYLVSQNDKVALATTSGGGWNSSKLIPKGFTQASKNKVIALSSSVVALEWEEGEKKTVTFLNTVTGEEIAQYDGNDFTGNLNKRIRSADSRPIVYVDNFTIDIASKKVTEHEKKVVGIVDGIVYLEDGTGKDADSGKESWKQDSAIRAPQFLFQRQGFYIDGETVYSVNVIHIPTAPSSSPQPEDK